MRIFLFFPICLMFTHSCGVNADSDPAVKRPNIILFLVDDLGWQDTSVPFHEDTTHFNRLYRTPNMERMAAKGMKFTQAYATAVCSPTRISLMTGMNAARHRVTNWTLHPDKLQPMETNHQLLDFPMWNVNGLNADTISPNAVYSTPFPQILRENGYRTIHVGKAHFGAIGTKGEDPLHLGFDRNIGGHAAGAPKSYFGLQDFGNAGSTEDDPWPVPGLEKYHGEDINLTEALTLEAIAAMDEALGQQQPFYLYLSHYAVHTPIMEDARFYHKYLQSGLDTIEAKYASMVESMDKSLGDILDFLEQKNINENTVVIFMSDNGGLSAVARGGVIHTHNTPLSSGKGSIREGGIREPMLVQWPARIKANSICRDYLIIEDFFPTILEMAEVKDYTVPQSVDGQSFMQMLLGRAATDPERPLYWHYPNCWGPTGPGIGAYSAIRKGDYKLIYYHENESFELFDITNDISEEKNVFLSEQEEAMELAELLTDYLKSVDAQMPTFKNSGKPVAWPSEKIHKG